MDRRRVLHRLGIISAASMIEGIGSVKSINSPRPSINTRHRSAKTTPNIILILCDQVRAVVCKR